MIESGFSKVRRQRGMILSLTIMILMVFALLTTALLGFGLSERTAASSQLLSARAFFAAEAGSNRAYYYLTNGFGGSIPSGWTGTTGCAPTTPWNCRTTGYTESVSGGDSFTVTVQDGTGSLTGTVVIISNATVTGRKRKIQMVLAGSGGPLSSSAISTPGTVNTSGAAGSVSGTIAGTISLSGAASPSINCPAGSGSSCVLSPLSALPKIGYNGLRAKAKAQGYYFKGTVTKDASAHCAGSAVGVCDSQSTPRCVCLPTTLTTTGSDSTGQVNVIFIDNSDFPASPSTANDGRIDLSGNYTLGGFIVTMGANPSSLDDDFGGTPTVNGVIFSLGDVRVHGGGSATNLIGGMLAAQGATLDGGTTISYDATKMARVGQVAFSPISWTELNP